MNKQIIKITFFVFVCLLCVHTNAQTKRKKAATKKTTATKKNAVTKKVVASKKVANTKAKPKAKSKPVTTNTTEQTANAEAKDTSKPGVVVLYSAFKPTLRNAAKINFNAATPIIDTTKIPLTYVVPAQNLFFSYQPVPIKPLALNVDSSLAWQTNQYIKAGFGSYSTPFIEAGLAFGDGVKTMSNVFAQYTSSKGALPYQQFSKAKLEYTGVYNNMHQQQWTTKVFYANNTQFLYGYIPATTVFTKDSLRQTFNNIGFNVGLSSKQENEFGLSYKPSLGINYYFDNKEGKELNILAKIPFSKSFSKAIAFDLSVTADISSFNGKSSSISNNLFYVNPSVVFKTPNLKINFGVQPTWDNSVNSLQPNITVEAKVKDEKFVAQAGWVGYYNKNNYQSLTTYNPYLQQPTRLFNTKVAEQYFGIKGSAGSHLTYNAKLSFLKMLSQPFFVNNLGDGKNYYIIEEPELKAIKIHGELGYSIQEKFAFTAAANITQFTQFTNWDKAFGLLPLELTGTLKWKILKDMFVKSDIFFWDGTRYLNKSLQTQKLDPAIDVNAGVEYTIMPKLNVWLQLNNVFNNRYQRWNQYEVLGLHVIGGVVYSFK